MRTDDDTDIITIVGTEIDGLMTALLLKHNFPTKLIKVIDVFKDWECRTPRVKVLVTCLKNNFYKN